MDRLLRKLHTESFVLTLRDPVATAPTLAGYDIDRLDEHTLEVEVSKDRNLNDLFARLSADGIEVLSMRNKVNRLERSSCGWSTSRPPRRRRAAPRRAPPLARSTSGASVTRRAEGERR